MGSQPIRTMLSESQSRHREPWTAAEDQVLSSSVQPDSALARQLGRTKKSVTHRRRFLGIGRHPASRRWTEAELRLIGTLPDIKVAALTGRTLSAIRTRRITVMGLPCVHDRWRKWTAEKDRLLGKVADNKLAKRFHCDAKTITLRRELLGIPRYQRENTIPWTAEAEQLLGTDTDAKVAHHSGCTTKSVTHRRHKLGIPPKPVDWVAEGQRRQRMAELKSKFGPRPVNPNDKVWPGDSLKKDTEGV